MDILSDHQGTYKVESGFRRSLPTFKIIHIKRGRKQLGPVGLVCIVYNMVSARRIISGDDVYKYVRFLTVFRKVEIGPRSPLSKIQQESLRHVISLCSQTECLRVLPLDLLTEEYYFPQVYLTYEEVSLVVLTFGPRKSVLQVFIFAFAEPESKISTQYLLANLMLFR